MATMLRTIDLLTFTCTTPAAFTFQASGNTTIVGNIGDYLPGLGSMATVTNRLGGFQSSTMQLGESGDREHTFEMWVTYDDPQDVYKSMIDWTRAFGFIGTIAITEVKKALSATPGTIVSGWTESLMGLNGASVKISGVKVRPKSQSNNGPYLRYIDVMFTEVYTTSC